MPVVHIPEVPRRRVWSAVGAIAVASAIVMLTVSGPGVRSVEQASAQEARSSGHPASGLAAGAPRSAAVALARLLPSSGLISVGARPGVRVVEIKVKEGDQVSAGALLAILEGHDAARSQLDLAESRKKRADEEWAARLDAARKAAELSIPRRDQAKRLYDGFAGTLKGKERYDADMALYQVQMEAIKAELELLCWAGRQPSLRAMPRRRPGRHRTTPRPRHSRPSSSWPGPDCGTPKSVRRARPHPEGPRASRRAQLGHPAGDGRRLLDVRQGGGVPDRCADGSAPGDPAEVDILGTRIAGKVTRIGSIVGKNQLTSIDPRACATSASSR